MLQPPPNWSLLLLLAPRNQEGRTTLYNSTSRCHPCPPIPQWLLLLTQAKVKVLDGTSLSPLCPHYHPTLNSLQSRHPCREVTKNFVLAVSSAKNAVPQTSTQLTPSPSSLQGLPQLASSQDLPRCPQGASDALHICWFTGMPVFAFASLHQVSSLGAGAVCATFSAASPGTRIRVAAQQIFWDRQVKSQGSTMGQTG